MREKVTLLVAVLFGLLPIRMARLNSSGRGGLKRMPRRITAKPT